MADDRMRRIEAEMAKFENEINQPMARPPMPSAPSGMALRFVPHSMQVRPPMMPPMNMMRPPMGMGMGMMPPRPPPMGMMGGRMPMPPHMGMPPFMGGGPGGPSSSSTIEAGPTRYLAPGAVGVKADKQADEPPPQPGPSKMLTQVLPSDVELLAAKRQQEVAYQNSYIGQVLRGEKKMKRFVRTGGGQFWEDPSLAEWDPSDYRIFCGDLGNEVSDELLAKAFRRYPSFQKAKVVREKRTNKSKGYGFVSFKDPQDFIRACREMDGKYVGNRPIKLRKSSWKERNVEEVKKKSKMKQKLGLKI